MDKFEELLRDNRLAIERFVYFKLPSKFDADDILQEVYITAYQKFDTLKSQDKFKAWIISIARNKCNDYFRQCAKSLDIPVGDMSDCHFTQSRYGVSVIYEVRDTLSLLKDKDQQILSQYFFHNMPQAAIAKALDIPIGTVKSRLNKAKRNFKDKYPYPPIKQKIEGVIIMNNFPDTIPKYQIIPTNDEIFPVRWEELIGWMIIPRDGEKLSWASYDFPEMKKTGVVNLEVVGRALVHGIEGVEIHSVEHRYNANDNTVFTNEVYERIFIAQMNKTHTRFLAESHMQNGIREFRTFLDGDDFLPNWGFGEDNCGNEIEIKPHGLIKVFGDNAEIKEPQSGSTDIIGRYDIDICGKRYETICFMDISDYESKVMTQTYLDRNGRTVLWRRFNRKDWGHSRIGQLWTERCPDNEQFMINGEVYVHWYDCISDYIISAE